MTHLRISDDEEDQRMHLPKCKDKTNKDDDIRPNKLQNNDNDSSENFGWCWLVGWLVGFYSISTLVSYLMPNSVYTYIKHLFCKEIVHR